MTFGRYSSLWLALATPLALAIPNIPPELYSPLITQRLIATGKTSTNPSQYPEWTTLPPYGGQEGVWQYFPTSTWTSGFFPASLYLAAERNAICPQGDMVSGPDASTMITQGAAWAEPLKTLETTNTVKHDVGYELSPANLLPISICLWNIDSLASHSGSNRKCEYEPEGGVI